jgi:hypothetical protein
MGGRGWEGRGRLVGAGCAAADRNSKSMLHRTLGGLGEKGGEKERAGCGTRGRKARG